MRPLRLLRKAEECLRVFKTREDEVAEEEDGHD
jgi:hypothetical protein